MGALGRPGRTGRRDRDSSDCRVAVASGRQPEMSSMPTMSISLGRGASPRTVAATSSTALFIYEGAPRLPVVKMPLRSVDTASDLGIQVAQPFLWLYCSNRRPAYLLECSRLRAM